MLVHRTAVVWHCKCHDWPALGASNPFCFHLSKITFVNICACLYLCKTNSFLCFSVWSYGELTKLSWGVAQEERSKRKELPKLALIITYERLELELGCIGHSFQFPCSCFGPPTFSDFLCLMCDLSLFPTVINDISTLLVDIKVEHIKHKIGLHSYDFYMWIPYLEWNSCKYWNSKEKILELPGYCCLEAIFLGLFILHINDFT